MATTPTGTCTATWRSITAARGTAYEFGHRPCGKPATHTETVRNWRGDVTTVHRCAEHPKPGTTPQPTPAATVPAEQDTPDTYAVRGAARKTTGHYRRPGTRELYCGRTAADPTTGRTRHMCQRCVKAAALDRAAAEQATADHRTTPDPLADWRNSLAYGDRVYDPIRRQTGMVINPRKTVRLPQGGSVRGAIVEFPHGYVTRVPLTDMHPVPAATDADRAAADTEARQAAALVTEAEATDGTWRGQWIGERTTTTAPALFDLPTEQGALFA